MPRTVDRTTWAYTLRYFGLLTPNSPLRAVAVALAAPAKQVVVQADPANISEGAPRVVPLAMFEVDQRVS